MRTTYIQHPVTHELIERSEYYANHVEVSAPMIMGDIQPYQSQVTGEMINGRRQHREHLKQHRLIEVGNEKPVAFTPRRDDTIRRDIIESVRKHFK